MKSMKEIRNDNRGEKNSEKKGKWFCEVKRECEKECMCERKMEIEEKNGKKQEENGRKKRYEMVRGGDRKTLISSSTSFI